MEVRVDLECRAETLDETYRSALASEAELAPAPPQVTEDGSHEDVEHHRGEADVPGQVPADAPGWLGLEAKTPPPPAAVLEISSTIQLDGDMLSFSIGPASAVANSHISDVPLPPGTSVMLVVRQRSLVAPRGETQLLPGDHVYVLCKPEDRSLVELLFGGREVE